MRNIEGKFIIAFDTLFGGWSCMTTEENGETVPVLFNSYEEAITELFNDSLEAIQELEDFSPFEGMSLKQREVTLKKMKKISEKNDFLLMIDFLADNPEFNYHDEFVLRAEKYIEGNKTVIIPSGVILTTEPA